MPELVYWMTRRQWRLLNSPQNIGCFQHFACAFYLFIRAPVLCQNSALLKDHGCNLMHRKVLASFYQHLMAEAPMRSV